MMNNFGTGICQDLMGLLGFGRICYDTIVRCVPRNFLGSCYDAQQGKIRSVSSNELVLTNNFGTEEASIC